MQKYLLCLLSICFFVSEAKAQDFAKWNNNSLILSNGLIEREIVIENGSITHKNIKNQWE